MTGTCVGLCLGFEVAHACALRRGVGGKHAKGACGGAAVWQNKRASGRAWASRIAPLFVAGTQHVAALLVGGRWLEHRGRRAGRPHTSFLSLTTLPSSHSARAFASAPATDAGKTSHGGLADEDRIFTNLYRQGDPFMKVREEREGKTQAFRAVFLFPKLTPRPLSHPLTHTHTHRAPSPVATGTAPPT